jgi:hypothetical protein
MKKTLFINVEEHIVEDYSNTLIEGQLLPVYGTYVAAHVQQLHNKRVGKIKKRNNLDILEEAWLRKQERSLK